MGGRIYLHSPRAAEGQGTSLLQCVPSPSQHLGASVLECCCAAGRPEQPDQLAKAHLTLTSCNQNHRAKKVEFLSQHREVPVGLYQQFGASSWQEKTQPSGPWWKSYSHTVLLGRAGGYGAWLGPAAGCPGIPWAPPDMNSHTRTAGGGKMPSSSLRDSTGCSQRCS